MLLKSTPDIPRVKINLSPPQVGRFMSYAWSDLTLESCMDCMVEVVKHYFVASPKPNLSELQELLLILRILQGKSWRMVCEELELNPPDVMFEIKNIAKKFSSFYFKIKEASEAEKFLFLDLETVSRAEIE